MEVRRYLHYRFQKLLGDSITVERARPSWNIFAICIMILSSPAVLSSVHLEAGCGYVAILLPSLSGSSECLLALLCLVSLAVN